jgi:transcriptional regulator with XRE-family HTH domain
MLRYQYSENNQFGSNLRKARKKAGLTLQQCADMLNREYVMSINKSSISKYENGIHEPGPSIVHCLCQILGVSREYLLGYTEALEAQSDKTGSIHEYLMMDDSMTPRYQKFDRLVIKSMPEYSDNMICLAEDSKGRRLVRRLTCKEKVWYLEPVNRHYQAIELGTDWPAVIEPEKNYKIIGAVIEMRRREILID